MCFYWDWELFIGFLGLLVSIVAVWVYWRALKQANMQNRLSMSQNIKNDFKEIISRQSEKSREIKFIGFDENGNQIKIGFTEAFKKAYGAAVRLMTIPEFQENMGKELTQKEFAESTFSSPLYLFNDICTNLSFGTFLMDSLSLINQINQANMLDQDKYVLKEKIKADIFDKTFQFYGKSEIIFQWDPKNPKEPVIPVLNRRLGIAEWKDFREMTNMILLKQIGMKLDSPIFWVSKNKN